MAKKKVDPLNRKQYQGLTPSLIVSDIKAAVSFYNKAFGFTSRGIMKGPDGKPMHAELSLRGSTLMLAPENPAWGTQSAKAIGATPATLYILVENVDKVFAKALKLGATVKMPVADMFWGDRVGTLVDPDGNPWMVATHKEDLTLQEMNKKMKAQFQPQASAKA